MLIFIYETLRNPDGARKNDNFSSYSKIPVNKKATWTMMHNSTSNTSSDISVTQMAIGDGVSANHSQITATNNAINVSPGAQLTVHHLTVNTAASIPPALLTHDAEAMTALPPRTPYYVSTAYEHKINAQLKKLEQQGKRKRIAITGIAGSGKTTLAYHYVEKYETDYPGHLTRILCAETIEQWWKSLREWGEEKAWIKMDFSEAQVIKQIQAALKKTPWCIVVDNWDVTTGPKITDITELFSINGTLLLTTQSKTPFPEENSVLELSQGFELNESRLLLSTIMQHSLEERRPGLWTMLGDESKQQLLIDAVDHLPLALTQAGCYILWENIERYENGNNAVFTYQHYETLLKNKVAELTQNHLSLLEGKDDIPPTTQEAAISLSLQKAIQPTSPKANIFLWKLLCFCDFLASDSIPRQLLKDYFSQLKPHDTTTELEENFNQTVKMTQRYSLLQIEKQRSVIDNTFYLYMHQVVQRVLRNIYWPLLLEKVDGEDNLHEQFNPMATALEQQFHPAVNNQSFPIITEYFPHAKALNANFKGHSNTAYLALQIDLTSAYSLLGEDAHAEALCRETICMITQKWGAEHIYTIGVMSNLVGFLNNVGKYTESESIARKVFISRKNYYGTTQHLEVAIAQQNLAIALHQLQRHNDAEKLEREALNFKIQYFQSTEHIEVARMQQNLGNTLDKLGRHEEAKLLLLKSLETKTKHYDTTKHIDVAKAQANLAGALKKRMEYQEAEALYQEALATTIDHYHGTENVPVARMQLDLAQLFTELKRYAPALELIEQCEPVFKTQDGGAQYLENCSQLKQTVSCNKAWQLSFFSAYKRYKSARIIRRATADDDPYLIGKAP